MKALSVRQPWASEIADGHKTIEVRSWSTNYRGPLLICAAARKHDDLPIGVAVAVVDLIDVRSFVHDVDEGAAMCQADPDDFAWVLGNVRRLATPLPVKGKLGLFAVEIPSLDYESAPTEVSV